MDRSDELVRGIAELRECLSRLSEARFGINERLDFDSVVDSARGRL